MSHAYCSLVLLTACPLVQLFRGGEPVMLKATMKRLAILIFLFSSCASAQSPTLVQHVSSSNTRGSSWASPYCYNYSLPGAAQAGNAIIVGVTFVNNVSLSVTDNAGDSYTVEENYYSNAFGGQAVAIAAAFNVAAGAQNISACFSGNPGSFVQPVASEFANVVGLDAAGTGNGAGGGTSVTAGNLTPSQSGDLIYQVTFSNNENSDSSPAQTGFTAGSQGNISWNLASADLMDGLAVQYGVYNATASINPAMSLGTSNPWVTAAILLKSGSAGSVPSGLRILHLTHENLPRGDGAGPQFSNPTKLQFPCAGNLLVAMMGGGSNSYTITGISDSNSNTWSQAGSTYAVSTGGQDTVQTLYAANANCSANLQLSVNWTGNSGDFTILFYDVAGAAASPLDTANGATGDQGASGNLTVSYSITPATPGELIFTDIIWDYNTAYGLSPGIFDSNTFSGESQSGPEPIDQNNGWGHYLSPSTSPITFTWIIEYPNAGLPVENWSSMAVAFKPAP
jgi:hypothetical protein